MPAALPTGLPLVGRHIRLDRFLATDVGELAGLLVDPKLYEAGYRMHRRPTELPEAEALVRQRYLEVEPPNGKAYGRICYAVRLVADTQLGAAGTLVGTTSYADIELGKQSGHIGYTLYGTRWWGTVVNPEAKLLLLTEAFETLGHGRVRIQTDLINLRSQAAIAKLGATREGVLRRETLREDGSRRDTVVYSVIIDEWPQIKAGLLARVTV